VVLQYYGRCNLKFLFFLEFVLVRANFETVTTPLPVTLPASGFYTTNARFVAFLSTFARPAQQPEVLLPGNDIQDPTTAAS